MEYLDSPSPNYTLDYTLGTGLPGAIFSVVDCTQCAYRFAVLPAPGGMWLYFDYYQHAPIPWLAQVMSERPICITPKCMGKDLDLYSLASVVTRDGLWLHLGLRREPA